VIGGVITSSLLTLVVVPVVYCYLDDLGAWAARKWRKHPPATSGGGGAQPVAASKIDGLS
jgi:HAE1 family hydrophobic/amphiphilic exporter-1